MFNLQSRTSGAFLLPSSAYSVKIGTGEYKEMKEEVYKTFEKVSLYADVEISNFGDVCAISRSKKPCRIYSNSHGHHFIKIWKVNHWETIFIELEVCKLFPEEKNNYTKDYLYREREKVCNKEKSIIKKDYDEGNSIAKISMAYKIREDAVQAIISEPIPEEKDLVLLD